MKRALVLILLLCVVGLIGFLGFRYISDCNGDAICESKVETEEVLKTFEGDEDSQSVYTYFDTYKGEATGMQARITFLEWGNKNVEEMDSLLTNWPEETRQDFF